MPSKILDNTALIDLGATNTRFALSNGEGVFFEFRIKTEKTEKKVIESLIRGLRKLKEKQNFERIGLSVAGPVRENATYLTNITASYIDLVTPVKDVFNVPVSIINDCSAAVLAEKEYGHGKNKDSILYITISSGIGGGVIKNDRLVWFPSVKYEVGHLKIDSDYGLVCKCGGIGHWQAFSSGFSLPHFFRAWNKRRSKKRISLKYGDVFKLFKQYKKGDKLVQEFFEDVSKMNAKAIDMLSEKYHPQVIVIGGSVALNNKEVIGGGIDKFKKTKTQIKFTKLGDEICLLGAYIYANKVEKTTV